MDSKFDAIVIGTGQAGPSLAVRLAKAGKKTAIIERKLFGGTCVNVGCIPSKTLIASARAAQVARTAADFGVVFNGSVQMDMKKVKARKDAIVFQSNKGVRDWLSSTANLTIIEGHASFSGRNKILVNGYSLEAEQIFINVGGRPSIPKIPGLEGLEYLTSSSIMDLDHLPQHLIIIGGSYIGLEFAQMFRRFGSEVTVIETSPRIISRETEETSTAVTELLTSEGVNIQTRVQKLKVSGNKGGVVVSFENQETQGQVTELQGSHLLVAVGRTPNTSDLGLENAGIDCDKNGYIKVDDFLATSAPGIWALGDVNGKGAFTHTAYNDFEIVAANLLDHESRKVSDRVPVYALYVDPPLARIGINEDEARNSGKKILTARMPMSRVGRAKERGETRGFMSVLVDKETKQILGATLFGIEADEVIQSILNAMTAKTPYNLLQRTMYIHPTVTELIPTLLEGLKPLT